MVSKKLTQCPPLSLRLTLPPNAYYFKTGNLDRRRCRHPTVNDNYFGKTFLLRPMVNGNYLTPDDDEEESFLAGVSSEQTRK